MESSKNKRIFPFLDRLKRVKHLDIIITVLFIAIILLIYFASNSSTFSKEKTNTSASLQTEEESYEKTLENSLADTISYIKGVGKVKVMLVFDEGVKDEIAYKYETKTLSDGSTLDTKTPILVTKNGVDEPIILQKIMPKVKSAIIVVGGGISTEVKLEILRLAEKSLGISTSNIEIFAGQ